MSALIFVVDDDGGCRRLVREVVEHLHHHAELFVNGREVLHRLQSRAPDLLILDIQMPGLSGLDVLKMIRQMPMSRFPVIAMTASLMPSERNLLADAEFSACLPKPLSLKRLADVIQAQLALNGEVR